MIESKELYPTFTFTAVDIETTGLDPKHDNIIEIEFVKLMESS